MSSYAALAVLLESAACRASSLQALVARGNPPRGARAEIARIRRAIRVCCPDLNQRGRLLALSGVRRR